MESGKLELEVRMSAFEPLCPSVVCEYVIQHRSRVTCRSLMAVCYGYPCNTKGGKRGMARFVVMIKKQRRNGWRLKKIY